MFRITPQTYAATLAKAWLAKWGWILIIPILIFALLGIVRNPAFYFVGLMVIFIVYPSVLLLVYFSEALRPETRRMIQPKMVEFKDEELRVSYFPFDFNPEEPASQPESVACFRPSEFSGFSDTGKFIEVRISGRKHDSIMIPVSAFASQNEASKAMGWLGRKIH